MYYIQLKIVLTFKGLKLHKILKHHKAGSVFTPNFLRVFLQNLIIKTIFKTHFKIKKNFRKTSSKKLFLKNIIVFLFFSKIFFKSCALNFFFTKNRKNQTNILKAPSRHKKFFHQILYEYFNIKISFKFSTLPPFKPLDILKLFSGLNLIFLKLGSNTMNRTKINVNFNVKIPLKFQNYFKTICFKNTQSIHFF